MGRRDADAVVPFASKAARDQLTLLQDELTVAADVAPVIARGEENGLRPGAFKDAAAHLLIVGQVLDGLVNGLVERMRQVGDPSVDH